MKNISLVRKYSFRYLMAAILVGASVVLLGGPVQAAACQLPSTDFGSASSTITVPAAGTYRLWSRVMVPNTVNNTYLLEVDGQHCFVVGGQSTPANVWTWVDYQDTNAKIDLALSQGAHTIKMIGRQSGVKLDRIVATSDLQCAPVGNGDNCNVPPDTTPPVVDLTSPASDATVSGKSVALTATAQDETKVAKVEFFINSTLVHTATSSPYTFSWDSTTEQNGTYRVTARAYDTTGNISSDSVTVTVQNGDSQAPTAPSGVKVSAPAYNEVNLTWQASTDNVGVKGYVVIRNNAVIAQLGNVTSYTDTSTNPGTQYSYKLYAIDAAGNKSAESQAVTVTTPTPATPDTQAPSVPQQLQASAANAQQINVTWQPSTDNTGVVGYEVYRALSGGAAQKVATVTTTSYGDTGLSANTEYTYTVKARDAAGNVSQPSAAATAKTYAKQRKGRLNGQITNSAGRPIARATVTVQVEGATYSATTNKEGRYHIRGIPQGRYAVTFAAPGYKSRTSSILVKDRTMELNAQLRRR